MAEIDGVVLEKTSKNEIVLHDVPLGETTQLDDTAEDLWTPDEAIRPPEDLESLSNLSNDSWVRSSCVDAMATNTVGLGHSCAPLPGSESYGSDSGQDATEVERKLLNTLDALAQRDVRLQARSFSDLLNAVKHDEEECGQGAIEVSRSKETAQIDGLFHVPGKRVRRLRDRKGWIVGQNRNIVTDPVTSRRFYNFGEKVRYDDDGQPMRKLAEGATRWETSELIVFRLYTSESRDYGLPRDVELSVEYLAAKNLGEWNASFFGSSGTNPAMLFVQGVEQKDGTKISYRVPQATIDRIQQALRSGAQKADKVAIIPLPPGAEAKLEELSKVSERDITFEEWVKRHERHVPGAFRLGPIFIAGLQDEGRYTAEVQRALGLEQVFDPEQRRYERIINGTILADLGYSDWAFKLKRLAVESDAAKRDSADKLAEAGGITFLELREAHGWGPFTGSLAHLNEQLVQTGLPKGAADRTVEGDDNRGLKPGIGGRSDRTNETAQNGNDPTKVEKHDHSHLPEYVEKEVDQLSNDLAGE